MKVPKNQEFEAKLINKIFVKNYTCKKRKTVFKTIFLIVAQYM